MKLVLRALRGCAARDGRVAAEGLGSGSGRWPFPKTRPASFSLVTRVLSPQPPGRIDTM